MNEHYYIGVTGVTCFNNRQGNRFWIDRAERAFRVIHRVETKRTAYEIIGELSAELTQFFKYPVDHDPSEKIEMKASTEITADEQRDYEERLQDIQQRVRDGNPNAHDDAMNRWDVELAKRARRCQIPGEDPWAILLPKIDSEDQSAVTPPTVNAMAQSGMGWLDAKKRAEEHVKAHGGVFPSVNRLAGIVGCSRRTIDKAVENSVYLKARHAESKKKASGRTVPLSDAVIEEVSESRDDQLARLVGEQQAELKREARQAQSAKKRRS